MTARRRLGACALAMVACVLAPGATAPAWAQGEAWVKEHYTKYEHRIAMRDGVKLFTAVYVPKDASQAYPILLSRTPYSCRPYGTSNFKDQIGPSEAAARDRFIVVYQDVRGRWMSEGDYVNMRPHKAVKAGPKDVDESTDTWDTIDWLVKHVPRNNGKVGMWGISYPGFYVSAGMIDAHPALKAASPQAPIADWFVGDDFHHNGALFLPHGFNFFSRFGLPRPEPTVKGPDRFDYGTADGYRFYLEAGPLANLEARYLKGQVAFWKDVMEHETYDDFWKARNLRPHLQGIKPAVMTVGGWFDAEDLFGALETYRSVERQSPGGTNTIVMGPWYHGGWSRSDGDRLGDVRFDADTAQDYRERIELPFFRRHLKGAADGAPAEAHMFETGRNQWHALPAWPPAGVQPRTLYFQANGGLSFDPPAEADASDSYVSDPRKPVPFIQDVQIGMSREYMVADQRFASRRPDVVVYQTPPLEEDLTLAGPLQAALVVSTSGTDSDWVVKLIDVYPDDAPDPSPAPEPSPSPEPTLNPRYTRMGGYQQLVRGEPFRGKFRNSFERPEAFTPGAPTRVEFTLPDVFHTFRRGHRVMVQVQSSWFPLVDLNPQTFTNIRLAKPEDFQPATQRVYRSQGQPSGLRVQVLPDPR
jgi:putative CocE/NonD family hydrolase